MLANIATSICKPSLKNKQLEKAVALKRVNYHGGTKSKTTELLHNQFIGRYGNRSDKPKIVNLIAGCSLRNDNYHKAKILNIVAVINKNQNGSWQN